MFSIAGGEAAGLLIQLERAAAEALLGTDVLTAAAARRCSVAMGVSSSQVRPLITYYACVYVFVFVYTTYIYICT